VTGVCVHSLERERNTEGAAYPAGRQATASDTTKTMKEEIMATPVTVPMVGKIVSVSVKVGDKVEENDQVAVLEAMKMEMPVVAPVSGVVKEVCVKAGQEVEAEAPIVVIE
jgi:acetyl-CoA carboxylase biotin carboxyl carrier protein